MNKLKHCPFCDAEAKLMKIGGLNTDKYQIKCKNNDCGISCKIYYDKEKAIKNWNKRISPWKTFEEEMPPFNEVILIKLKDILNYEETDGVILGHLYKCEDGSIIIYDYPLDNSYKLS